MFTIRLNVIRITKFRNVLFPSKKRILSVEQAHTYSSQSATTSSLKNSFVTPAEFELDGVQVDTDIRWWNISSNILKLFGRRLLQEPNNPLSLLKHRICNHFNKNYRKIGNRSPIFAICENEPRLVSVFDNFDSLLTPPDHPSRKPSDTYYLNSDFCLRAHTSAHQYNLLKRGLDNFLVVGDVYRRDQIDSVHYPCFHQIEGVRTYSADELFRATPADNEYFQLFANDSTKQRSPDKQECHTFESSRQLVIHLQQTLESLCRSIFGTKIEMRWVDAYFPFTHPSFELEVFFEERWLEVLGCGIIEQKLLESAGAGSKVGWAFGIGLERLAMILYGIPDIRLFWSRDTGFTSQFANLQPDQIVKYRSFTMNCRQGGLMVRHGKSPISAYPQLIMDLSFWLSKELSKCQKDEDITANVQDVIRTVGGDLIEQVNLIDHFNNKETGKKSHCYRIIYRSLERVLTKEEVNQVHKDIEKNLMEHFNVEIR